jgi:hypothetical protein
VLKRSYDPLTERPAKRQCREPFTPASPLSLPSKFTIVPSPSPTAELTAHTSPPVTPISHRTCSTSISVKLELTTPDLHSRPQEWHTRRSSSMFIILISSDSTVSPLDHPCSSPLPPSSPPSWYYNKSNNIKDTSNTDQRGREWPREYFTCEVVAFWNACKIAKANGTTREQLWFQHFPDAEGTRLPQQH